MKNEDREFQEWMKGYERRTHMWGATVVVLAVALVAIIILRGWF